MPRFDWTFVCCALLLATGCDKPYGDLGDIDLPATDTGGSSTGEPTTGGPGSSSGDNPAGACDPANDHGACGESHVCCSDDPATVGGKLPNYFRNGQIDDKHDVPIFSADNNALGTSGQCVDVGEFTSPFASGCPVPCNPTWSAARTIEICGISAVCCAFTHLDPARDCVVDLQTSRWRAVDGHDIGTPLTNWGDEHTTNQDRYGSGCTQFASAGDGPNGNAIDQAVLDDCYDQLTVADQRGFCYDPAACPCVEDLCDMKNADWVPRCGA